MKRKLLRIQAALLLAVCICFGMGQSEVKASGFKTEVRDSVVFVALYVEDELGNGYLYSSGSGFFIGEKNKNPEYLVTNHHVIAEFLDNGGGEYMQITYTDGTTQLYRVMVRVYYDSNTFEEAYIVDYNEKKDIAVLKLAEPTDKKKALGLRVPTDDMIGSTVYCVGYPGLSDNWIVSATTNWGKSDCSVTTGTVSRLTTSHGTGVNRIQTDAVIQQGNSGGPMVDANGYVLGVNALIVYESTDDTDLVETSYYAVNIKDVIPLLKSNSIPYFEYDSFPISKGLLIGIIAGVAVLLLVVLLVVALAGKGKKNKGTSVNYAQQPGMVQPGMVQPQMQSVKKGMVRSMSVQHNGVTYPVSETPILIGRDAANCMIVFREGTPGVSGRHCSVSYDSNRQEFLITDLRSSYGTFLMNGQKLEANVPYHLRSGESFYVGDKSNVLRVEEG